MMKGWQSTQRRRMREVGEVSATFLEDVIAGLSGSPKRLPCKYFYDQRGSELFDRICTLEEYYPTRTEMRLLADHAADIAALVGPAARLIELGSGSSTKIRILLDALQKPAAYIPIDISREHLLRSAARLAADYPGLPVEPVCADYVQGFDLPGSPAAGPDVAFFPGSTIGNFSPSEACTFLMRLRRRLGPESRLLIGVDLKKDRAILEPAYDDAQGVTAAFNLNLLQRINRELGGTFDLRRFAHKARYNDESGRIEMHLVSLVPQSVEVAGVPFQFQGGETIHTENSYKYSVGEFHQLASSAGWFPVETWTDADALFSIHYLKGR
jgi:L-histidine Nalpha-methyltransferase